MSVSQLPTLHINAIVQLGIKIEHAPVEWQHAGEHRQLTSSNVNEIGRMLVYENLVSWGTNYKHELTSTPEEDATSLCFIFPFKFDPDAKVPTALQGLKLINVYEYQSCESPDWDDSEALAFCRALKERLILQLPGYNELPWSWDAAESHAS